MPGRRADKEPRMKLVVSITTDDGGVRCSATVDDADAFNSVEANTMAVGALEIAKASLLAHRWGLNVGNLKPEPLVGKPGDDT